MKPAVTTVNSSVAGTRSVHKGGAVIHTNANHHTVIQNHGEQSGLMGPTPGYPTPVPGYPAPAVAHTVLPAHTVAPAVVLIPPTPQPTLRGMPAEHSMYITDQPNVKL